MGVFDFIGKTAAGIAKAPFSLAREAALAYYDPHNVRGQQQSLVADIQKIRAAGGIQTEAGRKMLAQFTGKYKPEQFLQQHGTGVMPYSYSLLEPEQRREAAGYERLGAKPGTQPSPMTELRGLDYSLIMGENTPEEEAILRRRRSELVKTIGESGQRSQTKEAEAGKKLSAALPNMPIELIEKVNKALDAGSSFSEIIETEEVRKYIK